MNPLTYLKALVGAVAAGLGAAYLGLDDGSLTAQEWVSIAQVTLASFATIWGIPNLTKSGKATVPVEAPQVELAEPKKVEAKVTTGPVSTVSIDLDGQ